MKKILVIKNNTYLCTRVEDTTPPPRRVPGKDFLLWYVLKLARFTNAEAFAITNVFGVIRLLPAQIQPLR